MRVFRPVLLGALCLLVAAPAGPTAAQLPAASPVPSVAPVMPVVGPDGRDGRPDPPVGPAWSLVLDRPLQVLRAQVVTCGEGFAVMAFGSDRRGRGRALTWTSTDGERWTPGEELRPRVDRIDGWSVQQLLVFRDGLFAFGGDGRALAVWRSADCGGSWRRLRDPAFALGRDAVRVNGIDAAATASRILVMGGQGGDDRIPVRRWAWAMDAEGAWERIPGALDGVVEWGLASDGASFVASGPEVDGDATPGMVPLVTSSDGVTWTELGPVPERSRAAVPDPVGDRFLFPNGEATTGWITNQVLTSPDGATWSLLAQAAPMADGSSGHVFAVDGVLVWIVDAGLDDDDLDWSWVAVSRDGGTSWTVGAGWPWMTLRGTTSVAANADRIVLLSTGPRFDAVRLHVLPR